MINTLQTLPNTTSELVFPAPIGDPITAWLGDYAGPTRAAYKADLGQWETWCAQAGIDPLSARPGHVTAWLDSLRQAGRRPATLARKVATLASFYKWARFNDLTTADPVPLRRPEVHSDDATKLGLDRDQIKAVLAASKAHSARAHALVALLVYCGLRVSEALGADVEAIGEQSGHRTLKVIGKGNRPRTVAVPAPAWHLLSEYLADRTEGPIFVTATGKRMDRQAAFTTVRTIGATAGVQLHPHLLRHSAATAALDAGAPLDRVQALLGHASPATTMRYAQARDRLTNSAAYDLARYLGE